MRYEFGCKVSVATTLDESFVVGMRSFQGNPYDGHTLRKALSQVEILIDQRPELAVVYRGHREHLAWIMAMLWAPETAPNRRYLIANTA